MSRILIAAAVAVVAAVAVPSVSQAATIHKDGRTPHRILLQDTAGQSNLVSVEGSKSVVFQDLNVPIEIDDVPTCMPLDEYTVSCSAVRVIDLDLGGGADVAVIDTKHPVDLEGGPGNDRYTSIATGSPSRVSFAGGIGLDTVSYGLATAGVNVALDFERGDGRPGDEDRIHRDVESVIGSNFADVLVGSDRSVQLLGLDGDDEITGGSAAEVLSGGHGDDRIDARDGAADTVDCGGQAFDRAVVDPGEASVSRCAQIAF
jgi:Ca2+-binding RTX toxin-like protein